MDDKEEKRLKGIGYSKGYEAGRKRTIKEDKEWLEVQEKIHSKGQSNRLKVYCSALNGLLACDGGNWKTNGERVINVKQYCGLAQTFVQCTPEWLLK